MLKIDSEQHWHARLGGSRAKVMGAVSESLGDQH